jgi:hypothetical protein
MAYRRYRNYSKPTARAITVKFAGTCACCGDQIRAGELAMYYPAGTIAGVPEGKIAHIGGLDGNSKKCAEVLKSKHDAGLNNYAGDGLDSRYEDDCASRCGF